MRIAVVIDTWFPFLGGGQVNAFEIGKKLADRGIRVDIITQGRQEDYSAIPENVKLIKINSKLPFPRLIFLIRVLIFLYRNNYDLVHLYPFLPGLLAVFLKLKKIPVIFSVFGTSINTKLTTSIPRLLESLILTKIKYTAQITDSRAFLKIKNTNSPKYIPHGVEVNKFDKYIPKKYKSFTAIFVGRLHPQKNLSNLIKAFRDISHKYPKSKLIIVGSGTQQEKLAKMVESLCLTNVEFKGLIKGEELIKIEKACHIFVLPSIYEGLPISLLEAWACKIPVIVSNTGDCPYLVCESNAGFLIQNPQNYKEISELLEKARKTKNLSQIGERGYRFVKSNFTWEKAAEKTLEVYEKAINS